MTYDEAKLEILSAVPEVGAVYKWVINANPGAGFKVRVTSVTGGQTVRFRLNNQEAHDKRGVDLSLHEFWQKQRDNIIR